MFKLEFLCEDKHLAAVLVAIAGKTYEPKIVPVINAKVTKGKVAQVTEGAVGDLFISHLNGMKKSKFTVKELRDWLTAQGRSATSYGYVLKNLGAKATKIRGEYEVRK